MKKISDEEFAIKNMAKLDLLDFFREGELNLQRYYGDLQNLSTVTVTSGDFIKSPHPDLMKEGIEFYSWLDVQQSI